VDSRSTYTVVSIASLLNMLTPELVAGTAEYLLSCQSFDGGFAGMPGGEAHGGYSFCAFAALAILRRAHEADLLGFERWLALRQMPLEGGFSGRPNKLVDSCYSFWVGGSNAVLEFVRQGYDATPEARAAEGLLTLAEYAAAREREDAMAAAAAAAAAAARATASVGDGVEEAEEEEEEVGTEEAVRVLPIRDAEQAVSAGWSAGSLLFNQARLQRYVLLCAQQPEGGLRDKPRKPRDYYHSCYALSGLSVAQRSFCSPPLVLGDADNLVGPTSALYNIHPAHVARARAAFEGMPSSHAELLELGRFA
jgi:protein farnesyltransferase subunit beta